MKLLRAACITYLILVLSGCNKGENPQEGEDDVVFSLEGLFNGESHRMEAGKSNVYLYTDYAPDSSSILEYSGVFGHNNCRGFETCNDAFKIIFRDVDFSETGGTIDSVLAFDSFKYTGEPDSTIERYQVDYFPNRAPKGSGAISWSLSPGANSSTVPFTQYYAASSPDIITACAEVKDGTCQNELCYPVNVTGACNVNFSYSVGSSVVSFSPMPQGQAPFTYEWDMGDGNGFVQSSTPPPFTFSMGDGWRKVCLRVTDANGCIATHCKNVILDTNYINCLVNFDYEAKPVYRLNTEQFGTIIIRYKDENGKEYRSDRFDQPEASTFVISDSRPYEMNENGQPTTLIEGTFDCVLYGDNFFDRISLTDMAVTFAVAHP